ncbi:hypothetical protein [Catalinimonas alkaloidigena]|uniref:hypothetical protein n=1 Tax=Catalinimonas alkaloidigena TaxID=1075417 RepID=UPI0024058695|nr:hypothetical protein [Catalinimonas alkaloidigena]
MAGNSKKDPPDTFSTLSGGGGKSCIQPKLLGSLSFAERYSLWYWATLSLSVNYKVIDKRR